MSKRFITLTPDSRKQLKSRLVSKESTESERIKILAILDSGDRKCISSIAIEYEVEPSTVGRWFYQYENGGIENLAVKPKPGRPPIFNKKEQKEIVAIAKKKVVFNDRVYLQQKSIKNTTEKAVLQPLRGY